MTNSETVEPGNDPSKDGEEVESSETERPSMEDVGLPDSNGSRLMRLAVVHLLVWLAAIGLYAAADSWSVVTGLGIAGFLSVIAGVLLGIATTTLIHEWFHYFGARYAKGSYDIPAKTGLFVFNWDFDNNSVQQFFRMSIAGSIGGAIGILLLWNAIPADTLGRAAVQGGALAGFVFGAVVEWPVLRRTRASREPFKELAKIDQTVLTSAFVTASLAGVLWTTYLA